MLPNRSVLHEELKAAAATNNVYFQPPENISMHYPCVVYDRSNVRQSYADDLSYIKTDVYTVTYISKDPDDLAPDRILNLRGARFDRHYASNNLHHTVITISVDRR